MATGKGTSLGAAVHDLLRISPVEHRSVKQQLHYLTAKTTGASIASVARQLGVPQERVKIWMAGKSSPTPANREKIERLFEKFWEINNRRSPGLEPGGRMLRVKSPGIHVDGRPRTSVIIEKGRKARDWDKLRQATAEDISKQDGRLLIEALDVGIPYLELRPAYYHITIL